ncbi:unnamed protein product [Miscanthus lutarioriparius]|uniref:Uncharacterized protein n=1 Tax=Miscanthus lutarioriparius TaxID=422564 RepID=A0A811R6L1_9POAL|nr:unnamed protein product [Miscanthus lutarioriparius]
MSDSSSVIMAEAAALALAAAVTETLNVHHINFLSDNQQLVHLFNRSDGSNPPNWRIKHLTQSFINHMKEKKYKALQGPQEPESHSRHISQTGGCRFRVLNSDLLCLLYKFYSCISMSYAGCSQFSNPSIL